LADLSQKVTYYYQFIHLITIYSKGINVDLIEKKDGPVCDMNEKVDLGNVLASHKKCVLFAVPGI